MSWKIELFDHVAVVTMNSNNMNLMNSDFFNDLNDTFDKLEKEYQGYPVVLTSLNKAFSAGLDITEIIPIFNSNKMDRVEQWYKNFRDSILRVFEFKYPIVAAVNGHAIAGGLVLALCCDYRFVIDNESKFGLNEITIGFPLPYAVSEIIKYAIGSKNMERSVFSGLLYNSSSSVNLGFFHESVNESDLLNLSIDFARQYDGSIMNSYVFSKKIMRNKVIENIKNLSPDFDPEMLTILTSSATKKKLKNLLEKLAAN